MLTIFKKLKKETKVYCDEYEKEVCVDFMQQCVRVWSMSELFSIVRRYFSTIYGIDYMCNHSFLIFVHGKLLNETKSLVHYVWSEHNHLDIKVYSLKGGSSDISEYVTTGLVSYSVVLERQMLKNLDCFVLQASESEQAHEDAEFAKLEKFVARHITTMVADVDLLSIFENFWLTFKLSRKCTTADDYITLACTSYKLFTGKSYTRFVTERARSLFGQVQSNEVGDMLARMRRMMNFAEEVGENPFFKKLTGLYSYLLVQGFLTKFGFKLSDEDYSRMEQRALQAQFSSRKSLWISVLDTTLFICERVYEWRSTGDLSVFLHSEGDYHKWMKEANRLLCLAPFTGNLEVHNTTYFSFISDLNDAVEKGEAYAKFSRKAHGTDVSVLSKKLAALQMLKNTEITKRATQKERKAPLGVLVYGGSSVGKSTFTKMLFYYYGSLMGLDKADHFRYVRNPTDEYWSNFDSSKWCIQLDDIAFLLPKKTTEVDPTLAEMLNVVNNVPYVPTQAALEDKGKTPVLAKLVIATSNAGDLNAREYFWCPLAVQRRLPFVVNIEPKKEYLQSNQKFLDPTKLPKSFEGYPNFWNITVSKVVPHFDGERDLAILETVQTYTDVALFLQDFGKSALAHETVQTSAMGCDSFMRDVEVCVICRKPGHKSCAEVQAAEETTAVWLTSVPRRSIWTLLGGIQGCIWWTYCWYVRVTYLMWFLQYLARFTVFRGIISRWFVPTLNDAMQLSFVGRVNETLTTPRKWKLALSAISILVAGFTLYVNLRPKKKEPEVVEPVVVEPKPVYAAQGNVFSTTEDQLKKEERTNVWYTPTLELSKFDLPLASQSSARSPDEARNLFANNCVRLMVQRQVGNGTVTCSNAGVFLKGHLLLTNNHAFKDDADIYRVTIIKMSTSQGLNSNLEIVVRSQDLIRRPGTDLVMFDVRAMPPHKNILKYWDFSGGKMFTRGMELIRRPNGELEYEEIFNMNYMPCFPIEELGLELPVTMGKVCRQTRKGDCGGIGVALTPRGPVIFGLHTVGYEDQVGIICIQLETLEEMIAEHESKFGVLSIVQGDGEPQLNLDDKKVSLVEPHYKSLFRYLPEGTLNIYGSFSGFRPKPKSSVCSTPLQSVMLDHFQCSVNHGKPVMEGWEPWRKNVIEMVKPTVNYRKDVLAMCVKTFTNDILTGLPKGWEGQLIFLSRRASVNGLPGVRFVDKLNTNTSMGFPWNCTKKRYLHTQMDEVYPEGVDFTPEVWERVDEIEKCYKEGRRAFPIFTGHLKDEPTTFAKIENKKTRVFTGGPVDWSIVVRSRLLTFVKLLQENKFLFEAGPGTVCQSAEWGTIHSYLTHFGDDRIVAGDYGKFDKRMIADFILAAFRIIASVYEAAGFTEDEVREILCIGEDTAFPVVNLNGDLVEFYGTNPSGHPLTVIINSIVNSLYMRYCYVVLNPAHESVTFKQNVHLFTYGDDNIMGVNRNCDWFNHCDIQRELDCIGVEYTMADKESTSVPFINIDNCQFLKRTWRFDADVKAWMCPLEEASIHKSLTVWCPSKTIDEYAQMVAVISSANSEYFFYGRGTFEKHHSFFKRVLAEEPYAHYVGVSTLPNWEQLVDRFNQAG